MYNLTTTQVWYGPDVKAVIKGLTTSYPYSYSTVHKGEIIPQRQDTIPGKYMQI